MADLNAQIAQVAGQPASVRVGTIASINPFTVSAQGVVFTDVGWLGSYVPNVGDSVIMLGQSSNAGADPGSWVALGRSSPNPGSDLLITQLQRNAVQNINNNSFTAISWDGIVIDNMNGFSGASTDFVAPYDGYYQFTGHCSFAVNAVGQRQSLWFLNGNSTESFVSTNAVANIGTRWTMHPMYIQMVAGDIMQQLQWQTSGGVLGTENATGLKPTMTVRYLGRAV